MESKTKELESYATKALNYDIISLREVPAYPKLTAKNKKITNTLLDLSQDCSLSMFIKMYKLYPDQLYMRCEIKKRLPIHYATAEGMIEIMIFILENSSSDFDMINSQDMDGNTPLHIAIQYDRLSAFKLLLDRGADHSIRNNDFHGPIHLCTHLMKAHMLEVLMEHPSRPDINLEDKLGGVALHYTAFTDDLASAQILMKHNPDHYKMCRNNFMPIHIAAHCGSYKVLKLFIEEVDKICQTRQDAQSLLTCLDGDKNMPLHGAIQFGNFHAAKVCLDNGSSIDETDNKYNNSAVHMAAVLGSMELLYLFKESQPDLFYKMLYSHNSSGQTPLHKAATADNIEVAKFLLDQGSCIDAKDNEYRTPLLLAASRNNHKMVKFLIQQDCDVSSRDSKMNNLLHLLINNHNNIFIGEKNQDKEESKLEPIMNELAKRTEFQDMINAQDIDGCTVLHYASRFDMCNYLEVFISHGADTNIKDNFTQSCLHFAAKYGKYSACQLILTLNNWQRFINEKDNRGQTALHLAAQNKHERIVQLLIKKGALFYNCYDGNSALHAAAASGSAKCVHVMHLVEPDLLNQANKDGNTALHLASKYDHEHIVKILLDIGALFTYNNQGLSFIDVAIKDKKIGVIEKALEHDRWEDILSLSSPSFQTPFIGIIKTSPHLVKMVMDRCVIKKYFRKDPKNFIVHYNFKYLNWNEEAISENGKNIFTPMIPLTTLVEYGYEDCLRHPLCQKLLARKWNNYGFLVHTFEMIFYILFLIAVTLIVVMYPNCIQNEHFSDDFSKYNDTFSCYNYGTRDIRDFKKNALYHFCGSFVILYAIMSLINVLMIAKIGLKKKIKESSSFNCTFWADFQTYCEALLYPLAIIFVLPFSHFGVYYKLYDIQWDIGIVVIFMAWFNLLLMCKHMYIFGIYVVMFVEILKTIVKVISLFSIIFIGFGLVFYICMNNAKSALNLSPHLAILRTFIMLQGSDIDGIENILVPFTLGQLKYGVMTMLFLVVFYFLMSILLTNMLIGLAVGDIDKIQKDAEIKRMAMEIANYYDLERKMPKPIFDRVFETEFSVYTNKTVNKSIEKFINNFKRIFFWEKRMYDDNFEKKEKKISFIKKQDNEVKDEMDDTLISENFKDSSFSKGTTDLIDQRKMLKLILDRLDGKNTASGIEHKLEDYKIGANNY